MTDYNGVSIALPNAADDPATRSISESFHAATQVLNTAIPCEIGPSLLP